MFKGVKMPKAKALKLYEVKEQIVRCPCGKKICIHGEHAQAQLENHLLICRLYSLLPRNMVRV
jgi:hypothetical protein